MFRNYFKIAIRNLKKNKLYFLVNLLGLGFAMSCCILSYSNYQYRSEFDQNHTNTEAIYRVNTVRNVEGNKQPWGLTPAPVARFLQSDINQTGAVARYGGKRVVVKSGDNVFHEELNFADKALFDWFSFPIKAGNKAALGNRNQLIINQNIAEKYFGKENAVGKTLMILDEAGKERTFEIGAVLDKIPTNSSFQVNMVTHFDNLYAGTPEKESSWKSADELTIFVKVPRRQDVALVESQLAKYIAAFNEGRKDWTAAQFYLQPFQNIAFTSDRDMSGFVDGRALNRNLRAVGMVLPAVLSILILFITCFNFTNTAIAFAGNRLKEIGIRKVLGGVRSQLVFQFLAENFLVSFSALLLALLLTDGFLSSFNQMLGIELKLNYFRNLELVGFLVGLAFITAFISGIYPAFYISSFKPITILKGKTRFSTGIVNKILLTVQFSICTLALVIGIILTQNANFQQQVSMGYDLAMLDVVPVANEKEFNLLQNAISNNPKILATAGTQGQVGAGDAYTTKVKVNQNEQEVTMLGIGDGYLSTVGIKVVQGRDFIPRQESEYQKSVIINQTFANQLQLTQPIGAQIQLDSQQVTVVGLVQDYKEAGNHGLIPAMAFRPVKPETYRYLNVKARPGDLKAVRAYVEAEWQKVLPTVPFQAFFQSDMLEKEMRMNAGLRTVCLTLALLIMLLSGVGLYGLVSLNILKRLKEIGVRKMLGASIIQIIGLVNREFIKIMLLSFVIGSALGYLFISKIIFKFIYVYHSELGPLPFVITLLAIAGGAALTIGHKVYKAAKINPSLILKSE